MSNYIGIRHEDKYVMERRAPLTPAQLYGCLLPAMPAAAGVAKCGCTGWHTPSLLSSPVRSELSAGMRDAARRKASASREGSGSPAALVSALRQGASVCGGWYATVFGHGCRQLRR